MKAKSRWILAIDPSGNFEEGKGTTGLALFDTKLNAIISTKVVDARNYPDQLGFWDDIVNEMMKCIDDCDDGVHVVIEDYLLYASKASAQTNSRFETPQLIGALKYVLHGIMIPFSFQRAVDVKNRWTDKILEHHGYIKLVDAEAKGYSHCHGYSSYALPINDQRLMSHELDAIRHAVHYATFKNKEK